MAAVFLSLVLLSSPVSGPDANSVRHALEARYQHARTLKAEFFERYSDGSGGVAAESGVVYFSRPGRMRWEYESPEPKLFLVDGKNAWFYVPADHTASRAKIRESSDWRTPLALLPQEPICLSSAARSNSQAHSYPAGTQMRNRQMVTRCCAACLAAKKKEPRAGHTFGS